MLPIADLLFCFDQCRTRGRKHQFRDGIAARIRRRTFALPEAHHPQSQIRVKIDRRSLLAGTLSCCLTAAGTAHPVAKPSSLTLGRPRRFSFAGLREQARRLASKPYQEPAPVPQIVQSLDFALSQKIKFRSEFSLWPDGGHPVRFFPVNKYADVPVRIHVVDHEVAREIVYAPRYFDFGGSDIANRLPANLGFSGFRIMNGRGIESDWLAFQGASYFRASGEEDQYGISARGIAVDTALSTKEEFPRFTTFWLAESTDGVTIFALLDSPSLAGAYRVDATRSRGVVTRVHAELFARADIARLGVAPLTSMYWYSDSNFWQRADWRPAIHDSDGLALWTGNNERIWRPLTDPPQIQTNSFFDTNPRGFGLLQRDREFDHYQDDGAFYNRRPSLWVEPLGQWGAGAVQLVEIPTDDEIHDNVVAYWQPSKPVQAGDALSFDYRLHWQDNEPSQPLGRVVATRIGRGGTPGLSHPKGAHKFVIDFQGGPLDSMPPRFDVTPVVTLSRGKPENAYVIKIVGTQRWRAFFDVNLANQAPLDMRCYLRLGNKTLTETWLYQFFPPTA